MPTSIRKPHRVYFESGIVAMLVEHGAGREPADVLKQVQEVFRRGGPEPLQNLPYQARPDKGEPAPGETARLDALLDFEQIELRRVLTFRHLDGERHLAIERDDPALLPQRAAGAAAFSLLAVPFGRQEERKRPIVRQGRKRRRRNRALIALVTTVNRVIVQSKERRLALDEGLVLRALAPNWMITPSPGVAGGGGPGTLPVPASPAIVGGPAAAADPFAGQPFAISVDLLDAIAAAPAATPPPAPQQVEVAILDTIPAPGAIAAAAAALPGHPLLQSLLQPGRLALSYHDDPFAPLDLPGLLEVRVDQHDYMMSDHGLFVAGLVHSVAPNAQIRLFEVLNGYGVGYVESIALVLYRLGQERMWRTNAPPMVVNCSLTLVAPLTDGWAPDPEADDDLEEAAGLFQAAAPLASRDPAGLNDDELIILAQLDLLSLAIRWIFLASRQQDLLVVAAAGNDTLVGSAARHQARYPAAFASVVGVGALDRTLASAIYSNRADLQPTQGLATFGGGAQPAGAGAPLSAVPNESVLGIYIGAFPPAAAPSAGASGWAWWAGTSFAAPIVSGAIAKLVGSGAATDLDAAHALLIGAPDGATGDGDEILLARQG